MNPFTGFPTKKLSASDKESILDDDKFLNELYLKLNIPSGGGGNTGSGGSSTGAVDSVNGQTGVVVLDSDDIAEGSTNLYSQWEVNTYTSDFLQPKDNTQGLVIGQDLNSSVASSFNGVSAIFNDSIVTPGSGLNYFINLTYGMSIIPLGGAFLGGHARGTAASPTQTLAGDYLGLIGWTGYDGTSAWPLTSYTGHLLPALWSVASANVGTYLETDVYLGSLFYRMIGFETDTNAIKFNESQLDSDITFYYDLGTALGIDGGTGVVTISTGLNMNSQLISSVLDPVSAQDAATKNYVDSGIDLTPAGDVMISDGYSKYVTDYYEVPDGYTLTVGDGAVMEIG